MAVEFDEDNYMQQKYKSRTVSGQSAAPSLSSFLIRIGIVKNESQANKFLVFLIILCLIGAAAIYYFFVANTGHAPIPASAIYGTQ